MAIGAVATIVIIVATASVMRAMVAALRLAVAVLLPDAGSGSVVPVFLL